MKGTRWFGRERWEVGGLCLLDFDFDLSILLFYVDFLSFGNVSTGRMGLRDTLVEGELGMEEGVLCLLSDFVRSDWNKMEK